MRIFVRTIFILITGLMACDEADAPAVSLSELNFNDSIAGNNSNRDSVTIIYSLSSGMCYGYCEVLYGFHPQGIEKIKQSHDGGNRINYPPLQQTFPITEKDYRELIASIDTLAFSNCPERIGCPGCNDGPAEAVEIWSGNFHKVVYIQYGFDAYPIQAVVDKVRELVRKADPD